MLHVEATVLGDGRIGVDGHGHEPHGRALFGVGHEQNALVHGEELGLFGEEALDARGGVVLGEHRGARFGGLPVHRWRGGGAPEGAAVHFHHLGCSHLVGVGLAGIGYARKAAGHFQHGAEVGRRVHGELPSADALDGFLHGAGCHRRLAGGQDAQQRGAVRAHLGQKLAGALLGGAGGIGGIVGAHRVLDDGHAIGVGGQKLRASFHVGQEDLGGIKLGGLVADGPGVEGRIEAEVERGQIRCAHGSSFLVQAGIAQKALAADSGWPCRSHLADEAGGGQAGEGDAVAGDRAAIGRI